MDIFEFIKDNKERIRFERILKEGVEIDFTYFFVG